MRKGFAATFVILGLLLIVGIAGGTYYYFNRQVSVKQKTLTVSNSPNDNDDEARIKDFVNDIKVALRIFFVNFGYYPSNLSELKKIKTYDDETLKYISNVPYYYTNDRASYQYYAKLKDGSVFDGDTFVINKSLDANVVLNISQIALAISIFREDTKRLPKTLDELSTIPSLSPFFLFKNPITGKPYTYIPHTDGNGYFISGTKSDGTEQKNDISIPNK